MQNPWREFADEKLSQLDSVAHSPIGDANHDFVLPADRSTCPEFVDLYVLPMSLQTFLPPVPYVGNPEVADVLVLAANPGFVQRDTPEYKNERTFVEQSLKSLKFESDYPIHYLDERFDARGRTPAYPGCQWWKAAIGHVVDRATSGTKNNIDRAQIVRRIAGVEWLPYHSNRFDKTAKNPAARRALFSQEYTRWLVVRAIEREAQIVVFYGRPHREMWEYLLRQEFPSETIFGSVDCSVYSGMKVLRSPYFDESDVDRVVEILAR